jgi:Protein of unknown function (DUF3631)
MAGGEWPARVEEAAMEAINEEDSNRNLQLLEAIWQVFDAKKVVRMHTEVLLDALKKIEEAPWQDAKDGREIDGYWLREQLKGFLPRAANAEEAAALRRSREWREGKGGPAHKGYTEDHLREAWWRYLERQPPSEIAKSADRAGAAPVQAPPAAPDPIVVAPPPQKSGASNGHGIASASPGIASASSGPAKRRTRPGEPEPMGEA